MDKSNYWYRIFSLIDPEHVFSILFGGPFLHDKLDRDLFSRWFYATHRWLKKNVICCLWLLGKCAQRVLYPTRHFDLGTKITISNHWCVNFFKKSYKSEITLDVYILKCNPFFFFWSRGYKHVLKVLLHVHTSLHFLSLAIFKAK